MSALAYARHIHYGSTRCSCLCGDAHNATTVKNFVQFLSTQKGETVRKSLYVLRQLICSFIGPCLSERCRRRLTFRIIMLRIPHPEAPHRRPALPDYLVDPVKS